MLLAAVIPDKAYFPGEGVRHSNHSHAIRELVAAELTLGAANADASDQPSRRKSGFGVNVKTWGNTRNTQRQAPEPHQRRLHPRERRTVGEQEARSGLLALLALHEEAEKNSLEQEQEQGQGEGNEQELVAGEGLDMGESSTSSMSTSNPYGWSPSDVSTQKEQESTFVYKDPESPESLRTFLQMVESLGSDSDSEEGGGDPEGGVSTRGSRGSIGVQGTKNSWKQQLRATVRSSKLADVIATPIPGASTGSRVSEASGLVGAVVGAEEPYMAVAVLDLDSVLVKDMGENLLRLLPKAIEAIRRGNRSDGLGSRGGKPKTKSGAQTRHRPDNDDDDEGEGEQRAEDKVEVARKRQFWEIKNIATEVFMFRRKSLLSLSYSYPPANSGSSVSSGFIGSSDPSGSISGGNIDLWRLAELTLQWAALVNEPELAKDVALCFLEVYKAADTGDKGFKGEREKEETEIGMVGISRLRNLLLPVFESTSRSNRPSCMKDAFLFLCEINAAFDAAGYPLQGPSVELNTNARNSKQRGKATKEARDSKDTKDAKVIAHKGGNSHNSRSSGNKNTSDADVDRCGSDWVQLTTIAAFHAFVHKQTQQTQPMASTSNSPYGSFKGGATTAGLGLDGITNEDNCDKFDNFDNLDITAAACIAKLRVFASVVSPRVLSEVSGDLIRRCIATPNAVNTVDEGIETIEGTESADIDNKPTATISSIGGSRSALLFLATGVLNVLLQNQAPLDDNLCERLALLLLEKSHAQQRNKQLENDSLWSFPFNPTLGLEETEASAGSIAVKLYDLLRRRRHNLSMPSLKALTRQYVYGLYLGIWLSLCYVVAIFQYCWCIRKPGSSSITFCNKSKIAQQHHTNNNPYIY